MSDTIQTAESTQTARSGRVSLNFWQILNMNVGFFGIQFSFGLQQSNMSPIYKYLGADEGSLPYLWLAGPLTGLIVQPLIGAMSDRTISRWGRRTPYFLIGAILCSLGLLAMPFSPVLWMAASLLWILDAANNVTMEPYRAFISDKLLPAQRSTGFLTQSAMTGLGQTLAYLTPSLLVWLGMNPDAVNQNHIPHTVIAAFMIGAVFSVSSVLWSLKTSPEIPLSDAEVRQILTAGSGWRSALTEIVEAFRDMPQTMKQLAWMKLFQWYALFCYWQYVVLALAQSVYRTSDPAAPGFRQAALLNGELGAFYNLVAFFAAFLLLPLGRRFGARASHAFCLLCAGLAMCCLPHIHERYWLFLPMLGIGLAWASIMGNPYVMLASCIPPARTGVYMGIFNMFIVIPMIIQIFTLPLYYHRLLGGQPAHVIELAGVLLLFAALATLRIRESQPSSSQESVPMVRSAH